MAVKSRIFRIGRTSSRGSDVADFVAEKFRKRISRETRRSNGGALIPAHHRWQWVPQLAGVSGAVRDESLPEFVLHPLFYEIYIGCHQGTILSQGVYLDIQHQQWNSASLRGWHNSIRSRTRANSKLYMDMSQWVLCLSSSFFLWNKLIYIYKQWGSTKQQP